MTRAELSAIDAETVEGLMVAGEAWREAMRDET